MDRRIKELVNATKTKFGLDNYYLQRHTLDRTVNIDNETNYTLAMEWFPNHETDPTEDDLNPDGTAVIEMDIHRQQYESVIFVGDTSFANGVQLSLSDQSDIINWLEQETGLVYNEHFTRDYNEAETLRFKASDHDIPVYPTGTIEVKTDQEGNLTLFTCIGYFPGKDLIKEETYTLSLEKIEHMAGKQIQLMDWPIYEQEQLLPIYAVEEFFITNDQLSTMAYDITEQSYSYTNVNKTLHWHAPLDQPFDTQEIQGTEDIKVDQAFEKEPSPDGKPISQTERDKTRENVHAFLRHVYPDDTGKWTLTTLHRDQGYIHAILRETKHTKRKRIFQRKLVVILGGENVEVLNYLDNQPMLDMLTDFKAPENVEITMTDAYEKLKDYFELNAYYVYDVAQKQYVLCGKVDCQYAVNACTGEIVNLEEL